VFRLLRLKRFSTFSVKVLNLFSRSRRKTNKRKSKHSAMLRNKETRHRMFKIAEGQWRITIPLTLSNLKLLRRITRTENILHRNFTRRQVAIQNRVASNIGISQSTFSVKVLNLFSRSRRKT